MLEELLTVLDGGPGDRAALGSTAHLLAVFGGRATLLSAAGDRSGVDGRGWHATEGRRHRSGVEAGLADRARELSENLESRGVPSARIRTTVACGRALDEAARVVRRSGIDTVIVSRADAGGPARNAVGAHPGLLLESLGTSLLLARRAGGAADQEGPVFVPLDGSERAEWGLAPAVRLAAELGSELCLAGVVGGPEPSGVSLPTGAAEGLVRAVVEARLDRARRYLEGWAERLGRGSRTIRTSVRAGCGVARIVGDLAEEARSSWIVVGARGSASVGRAYPGRVSSHLLEEARASVLVLQEREGTRTRAAPSGWGTGSEPRDRRGPTVGWRPAGELPSAPSPGRGRPGRSRRGWRRPGRGPDERASGCPPAASRSSDDLGGERT